MAQGAGTKNRAVVTATQAKAHFNDTLTGANGIAKVNVAPVASLSIPNKIYINQTVNFQNTSYDPNGDAITSQIILKDPDNKTYQTTTTYPYKFSKLGIWTLSITSKDNAGLSSKTVTYNIDVQNANYLSKVATETNPANVFWNYTTKIDCTAIRDNTAYAETRYLPSVLSADQAQIQQIALNSTAKIEYQRMPNFFNEWVRANELMNRTERSVYLSSLVKAVHEVHHYHTEGMLKCDQDNINSIDRGYAKYFVDGQWYTTDIKLYWTQDTNNYAGTGATYTSIDTYLPEKYKKNNDAYRAYVLGPQSVLRAEALIDELTAYTKASIFEIDFLSKVENYNLRSIELESSYPLSIHTDLNALPYIMLFVECYLKEMRTNSKNFAGNNGAYATFQSARTRAYFQKLWTMAEQVIIDGYKYTYNENNASLQSTRADWKSIIRFNNPLLADVYSPEFLSEIQALGIQTKSLDFWKDTYLK